MRLRHHRAVMAHLIDGGWIDRRENLLVTGQTGLGKSWIACALGHKACRDGRSVVYHRVPRLFEALALARGDGRHARMEGLGAVVDIIPHSNPKAERSARTVTKVRLCRASRSRGESRSISLFMSGLERRSLLRKIPATAL